MLHVRRICIAEIVGRWLYRNLASPIAGGELLSALNDVGIHAFDMELIQHR